MQVSVLGAGTMGRDIAHVCAVAGHEVTLRDIEQAILDDAIETIENNLAGGVERGKIDQADADEAVANIETMTDLEGAVTDAAVVIEAVPEDIELKQEIFTDVEQATASDTLLATNTSSLSVTELASVLEHPDRVLGLHFFNPAYIMELVEVVVAEQTDQSVQRRAESFVEGIDRTPITVQDTPGFASSRLGVSLGVEAIRMLESGVAEPRDIDQAMTLGYNHPMGPIELTDHIGLDVRLDVLEYLREELGERFRPPQLLKRKVRAGHLGKKTGQGFYVWEDGEIAGVTTDE